MRQPLEKRGIEFQEVYAHRVLMRGGTTVSTSTPRKIRVGYYFVAAGKKPHVQYGVMTDADLTRAELAFWKCMLTRLPASLGTRQSVIELGSRNAQKKIKVFSQRA